LISKPLNGITYLLEKTKSKKKKLKEENLAILKKPFDSEACLTLNKMEELML